MLTLSTDSNVESTLEYTVESSQTSDNVANCDMTYTLFQHQFVRQISFAVRMCYFISDSTFSQTEMDAKFTEYYYLNTIADTGDADGTNTWGTTHNLPIPGFEANLATCNPHIDITASTTGLVSINVSKAASVDGYFVIQTDSP